MTVLRRPCLSGTETELTETSSCQTLWLCDGLSVRRSERTPRLTGLTATSMKDTHKALFFLHICTREEHWEKTDSHELVNGSYLWFFFAGQSQGDSTGVSPHLCFPYTLKWHGRDMYYEGNIKGNCLLLKFICKVLIFSVPITKNHLKTHTLWLLLHRASQPSRKNGLKGSIIALFHALPCVCQKYPRWWIGRRNLRLVKVGFSGPDIV